MKRLQRAVTPSHIDLLLRPLKIGHSSEREKDNLDEDSHLIQVSSHLFLGNLGAIKSEQLLCSNKIGALVNVGSLVTRDRTLSSRIPCTCPIPHFRAKLSVHLEDNVNEDFRPYLKEINLFIHRHRLQMKNVLVYSDAGLSRAPAIIAQYLVQVEHRSLTLTLAYMKTLRPQLNVNPGFVKILRKLERYAYQRDQDSTSPAVVKIVSGFQKFMSKTPTTGQLLSATIPGTTVAVGGRSNVGHHRGWPVEGPDAADNRILFAKKGRLASFRQSVMHAWS